MKRLNIGVDLDGTSVAHRFSDEVRNWRISQGHPAESMPESRGWFFYEEWGMDLDKFIQCCDDAAKAGFLFNQGEPMPGSIEALGRLKQEGHRITILTDRFFGDDGIVNASEANSYEWLSRHTFPYDEIVFTRDKTIIPVDTMIDDKPANYDALEAIGRNPYLYDQPWNQDTDIVRRRVHSWREYENVVRDIAIG